MRAAFDEAERGRIRRGLAQYKDQHGIGVPTLQARICDAIGDKIGDRVPLKTLQRFLSGTHRSDDAFVAHLESFLMQVAPPPPEQAFADSLRHFLLSDEDHDYASAAGAYYSFIITRDAGSGKIDWTPYSVLTLEPAPHGNYLLANEVVHNIDRSSAFIGMGPEFFERSRSEVTHSGLYMHAQHATFMLFTRGYFHSRICMLGEAGPKHDESRSNLFGDALEPYGKIHSGAGLRKDFEIRYFARENTDKSLQEMQQLHP